MMSREESGQLIERHVERRVLSYLPLAHVYERVVIECCTFVDGRGRIFFTESLATFPNVVPSLYPCAVVPAPVRVATASATLLPRKARGRPVQRRWVLSCASTK